MKITINDHRKILAIQGEFTSMFPNLGIEFFAKPSKTGGAASKKLVGHSKNLLDCRVTHEEGTIELLPTMTPGELKDHFSDAFGLTVEVIRKSGSLPVGTKLTLAEENQFGKGL